MRLVIRARCSLGTALSKAIIDTDSALFRAPRNATVGHVLESTSGAPGAFTYLELIACIGDPRTWSGEVMLEST